MKFSMENLILTMVEEVELNFQSVLIQIISKHSSKMESNPPPFLAIPLIDIPIF